MIDHNPCHGCTERYTACHDRCERRAKWLEQHRAEQKHLAAMKYRWAAPWTAAGEQRARRDSKFGTNAHKYGGSQ